MPAEETVAPILSFFRPGAVITPNTVQDLETSGGLIHLIIGDVQNLVTDGSKFLGTATAVEFEIGGTTYTLWCLVSSVAAAYIATGWAIATAEVSVPTAAILALGVVGGVALYASFPYWITKLSDFIFGNFIDGLPVFYINHEGKVCIDSDTMEKTKDYLLSEPEMYQSYGHPEPSATGKVTSYIQNKFNMQNPIQIKEQLTLSQILELFDNGTNKDFFPYQLKNYLDEYGIPTDENTGILNPAHSSNFEYIMKSWYTRYGSDTLQAKQRRNLLLEFLNTYWNNSMNFSYYINRGDSDSAIILTPISAINSYVSLDLPKYYPDKRNNTVKLVKARYEKEGWPAGSTSSLLATSQKVDFGYKIVVDGNQTIDDVTYTDGQQLNRYYFYDVPYTAVIAQNSYNLWTYKNPLDDLYYSLIDYEKWSVVYLRDSVNIRTELTPPISGHSTTDMNFVTPNGQFYVVKGPRVDFASSSFLGIYGVYGLTYWLGSIGAAEYYTNPTTRSWVLPETTVPNTDPLSEQYPDWPVHEPSEDIGKVYEVNPMEEAASQPDAQQTPDPSEVPGILQKILDILQKIKPDPTPQPDPEPSPEPSPVPTPEPVPVPSPDPEPNPPQPSPVPSPVPVIPDFVVTDTEANNIFRVWNPTQAQVNSLASYIWSSDWYSVIPNIWSDPLAPIISFKRVYASPQTDGTGTIWLGMNNTHVNGVKKVSTQYTRNTLGSIFIPESVGNATDYSPYTQMHLYMPFVGIQEVDVDDFMGKYISLRYTFDIYTGACLVEVFAQADATANKQLLYAYGGNAAQEIPLSSATYQGLVNTIVSVASSALTAVAAGGMAAGMGASGAGVGAGVGVDPFMKTGAANSLGSLGTPIGSIFHEMVHYGRSGSLQSNVGVMANRYPQIIISNRNRADAANYASLYGYPANKTVRLGNLSGYAKVRAVQLGTFATQPEKAELELLLKGGVIF